MFSLSILLEAVLLASALSLDAFIASFGYGSNHIKIPAKSIWVINLVCSATLGVSLWIGAIVRRFIPQNLTVAICFTILFLLGLTKLLDSVARAYTHRHSNLARSVDFSMFHFRFVLSLYADPKSADVDHSQTISPFEAASLALALSLDGMAVGFGASMGDLHGWAVFIASLGTNIVAVLLGCFLGNKVAKEIPFNLSWLSGAVLIGLALQKLV